MHTGANPLHEDQQTNDQIRDGHTFRRSRAPLPIAIARDADRAADVLQIAYLKVLNGKAAFDARSSFKTWLFAVIRRTAADYDDARAHHLPLAGRRP